MEDACAYAPECSKERLEAIEKILDIELLREAMLQQIEKDFVAYEDVMNIPSEKVQSILEEVRTRVLAPMDREYATGAADEILRVAPRKALMPRPKQMRIALQGFSNSTVTKNLKDTSTKFRDAEELEWIRPLRRGAFGHWKAAYNTPRCLQSKSPKDAAFKIKIEQGKGLSTMPEGTKICRRCFEWLHFELREQVKRRNLVAETDEVEPAVAFLDYDD